MYINLILYKQTTKFKNTYAYLTFDINVHTHIWIDKKQI